jgi:nucleoside phosphorylase
MENGTVRLGALATGVAISHKWPGPLGLLFAFSDLADKAKDDSWHPFATTAAARLAAALVRAHVIP